MMTSRQNEKALNIVFFMNVLCEGAGMINRERAMSESLVKAGHQVTILSYFKPSSATLPEGVKVRYLMPSRFRGKLYSSPWIQPFSVVLTFITLLFIHPDWVCVDQAREAKWARLCRKWLGFKVLFTYHGVANDKFYPEPAASGLRDERRRSHIELSQVDRVVVVSDFLKAETSSIGVRAVRVHNGVQREEYHPQREMIQRDQPNPLVVGINRYTQFKRIENLIKAFAIAHKQCPSAKLWLFGYQDSKAYVKELQDLVDEKGLTHHVQLNGPLEQAEMPVMMRRADVFANGSTDENFCMPLLEAQACGTPSIGFAAGGVSEVIQHGVTGYLAKADDVEDYAAYLADMLKSPTLRAVMSERTQNWVAHFEYDALARELMACMRAEIVEETTAMEAGLCHV